MRAPAQNPPLDLLKAPQLQRHLQLAVAEWFHFLRGMPCSFAHQPRGKRIEPDLHRLYHAAPFSGKDPEALAQMTRDRKIRRAQEFDIGLKQKRMVI